jgi:hypothetical protein
MLPGPHRSKAARTQSHGPVPQVRHISKSTLSVLATDEETSMALQNHLTELERKHEALERELHDTVVRPAADAAQVAELKRRKLQLKDEISRLRRTSH